MNIKQIGGIYNHYGGLNICKHKGKFYWCIENYDTGFDNLDTWDEIDEELYNALIDYQDRTYTDED